jgi:hypothetical protein
MSHGGAAALSSGLEAATLESLSPDRAERAFERALASVERESGRPVDAEAREELDRLLRRDGRDAIERLRSDGPAAQLTSRHESALEAIVEVDGSRPTLAVSDGDEVDPDDEALGDWRTAARKFARQISLVASAVGRIDLDGKHMGTGFVVKEGLILTNRHVLQQLARSDGAGRWAFLGEPTITFDAAPERSRRRQFEIRRTVPRAGPDAIDFDAVDYNKLDFAILQCEVPEGKDFPAPLFLERDMDKIAERRPIFTVGYPAEPRNDTYESDVLQKLFRRRFGVKRFSPGEIDRALGSAEEGTGATVFGHDATTLSGNSGSCVVDLGNDGRLVVGLHFAGVPKQANFAHSSACLRGPLAELGLGWKDWLEEDLR